MGVLKALFGRGEPEPLWLIEHEGAKGRLVGSNWEVQLPDGRTFRAYSSTMPHNNEWTLRDKTPATAAEKAILNKVVQAYRDIKQDPWRDT